jgi:acetoin utilization protein AcuB
MSPQEESGMEIARWMKHPVHTVRPRDSIQHARELLARHRVNQLPVVLNRRLVGIVTDRDLRDAFPSAFEPPRRGDDRRAAPDPRDVPVDAVMTQHVLTLHPRDSIAAAARLLRRERIGAIPIVDGGQLLGILTRSDLLDAFGALLGADDHDTVR